MLVNCADGSCDFALVDIMKPGETVEARKARVGMYKVMLPRLGFCDGCAKHVLVLIFSW
jgi:hypothetical protein